MKAKTTIGVLAVLGWLTVAAGAAAADTIRCGGMLIDPGMTAAEVEARCGEPTHKEVERVPVRGRNRAGASIELGVTTVERWTYERGRRFPARLTFEEGKLTRIELLTRP